MRVLGVLPARHHRGATLEHVLLVLTLQQHQDVLEQHHVQLNLLGAPDAPRQLPVVHHGVLGQVQVLGRDRWKTGVKLGV